MALKRKFNLKNLGNWVPRKKEKTNGKKAGKENVSLCMYLHFHSKNQLPTADTVLQKALVAVRDSVVTSPGPSRANLNAWDFLREPNPCDGE